MKHPAARDVPYHTVDVTEDEAALAYILSLGYLQAPVVRVGDSEDSPHWSGFIPDNLKEHVTYE